jgi:hypothetical protein
MDKEQRKQMVAPFLQHMVDVGRYSKTVSEIALEVTRDECDAVAAYRKLTDARKALRNHTDYDGDVMFRILARIDGGKVSYTQHELEKWCERQARDYAAIKQAERIKAREQETTTSRGQNAWGG